MKETKSHFISPVQTEESRRLSGINNLRYINKTESVDGSHEIDQNV